MRPTLDLGRPKDWDPCWKVAYYLVTRSCLRSERVLLSALTGMGELLTGSEYGAVSKKGLELAPGRQRFFDEFNDETGGK